MPPPRKKIRRVDLSIHACVVFSNDKWYKLPLRKQHVSVKKYQLFVPFNMLQYENENKVERAR